MSHLIWGAEAGESHSNENTVQYILVEGLVQIFKIERMAIRETQKFDP